MPVETFIDTHVFVYRLDSSDPRKTAIADRIIYDALQTGLACLSQQVVQECLSVLTSKARVRLPAAG